MTTITRFDVAVIGGGVLGTAIAARLSQTDASVCLLEAAADVGEGASKGNAGVAVSYYGGPDDLDTRLINASNSRWEEVCQRLDVPYRRVGALMVALDDAEAAHLSEIQGEVTACGVRSELLTGRSARTLEPLVSDRCRSALWMPDEGVIDPMRLTIAYAELAVRNGATIRLGAPVIGFVRDGDRVVAVSTPRETIRVEFVVNATGLALGTISALAGGEAFKMWPRTGEYLVLDREFGSHLNHIVFATQLPDTKGIHVIPTTSGTALLGPTAEDGGSPENPTHELTLDAVFHRARRLIPSLSREYVIKSYAASRPASDQRVRVRPDANVPNLLHVSNRSTGVAASLGTADLALELLQGAGLAGAPRTSAVVTNPPVRRLLHDSQPEQLSDEDPRYGQVVCVCEQVSAAEIAAALESPVPARSIAGVWKRTHATGGRCQGSVCMAGVAFMCSLAHGLSPADVLATDSGTIGVP